MLFLGTWSDGENAYRLYNTSIVHCITTLQNLIQGHHNKLFQAARTVVLASKSISYAKLQLYQPVRAKSYITQQEHIICITEIMSSSQNLMNCNNTLHTILHSCVISGHNSIRYMPSTLGVKKVGYIYVEIKWDAHLQKA